MAKSRNRKTRQTGNKPNNNEAKTKLISKQEVDESQTDKSKKQRAYTPVVIGITRLLFASAILTAILGIAIYFIYLPHKPATQVPYFKVILPSQETTEGQKSDLTTSSTDEATTKDKHKIISSNNDEEKNNTVEKEAPSIQNDWYTTETKFDKESTEFYEEKSTDDVARLIGGPAKTPDTSLDEDNATDKELVRDGKTDLKKSKVENRVDEYKTNYAVGFEDTDNLEDKNMIQKSGETFEMSTQTEDSFLSKNEIKLGDEKKTEVSYLKKKGPGSQKDENVDQPTSEDSDDQLLEPKDKEPETKLLDKDIPENAQYLNMINDPESEIDPERSTSVKKEVEKDSTTTFAVKDSKKLSVQSTQEDMATENEGQLHLDTQEQSQQSVINQSMDDEEEVDSHKDVDFSSHAEEQDKGEENIKVVRNDVHKTVDGTNISESRIPSVVEEKKIAEDDSANESNLEEHAEKTKGSVNYESQHKDKKESIAEQHKTSKDDMEEVKFEEVKYLTRIEEMPDTSCDDAIEISYPAASKTEAGHIKDESFMEAEDKEIEQENIAHAKIMENNSTIEDASKQLQVSTGVADDKMSEHKQTKNDDKVEKFTSETNKNGKLIINKGPWSQSISTDNKIELKYKTKEHGDALPTDSEEELDKIIDAEYNGEKDVEEDNGIIPEEDTKTRRATDTTAFEQREEKDYNKDIEPTETTDDVESNQEEEEDQEEYVESQNAPDDAGDVQQKEEDDHEEKLEPPASTVDSKEEKKHDKDDDGDENGFASDEGKLSHNESTGDLSDLEDNEEGDDEENEGLEEEDVTAISDEDDSIKAYHVPETRIKVEKESDYIQVTDGIRKLIIRDGHGRYPEKGDLVTMHCVGYIDKIPPVKFWNTKDLGQRVFSFTIGEKQVIKGWDQGVASMRLGERSKLKIEAKKAYGKFGFGAWQIPPNADLLMEFEILNIQRRRRFGFPKK
ncbi:uncharacterized protein LOC143453345 [Clavelina lepadiformis]|uniref:uncharacterized protein LOC143453345 n=1 Tax=Clavelina lepadiformis TaxID=159417 RepID=UPI0040411BD0